MKTIAKLALALWRSFLRGRLRAELQSRGACSDPVKWRKTSGYHRSNPAFSSLSLVLA